MSEIWRFVHDKCETDKSLNNGFYSTKNDTIRRYNRTQNKGRSFSFRLWYQPLDKLAKFSYKSSDLQVDKDSLFKTNG